MARIMDKSKVLDMAHQHFPSFLRQREKAQFLDKWHRGEQQDYLYKPEGADLEYNELMLKSPTPWGGLIVKSVVQQAEFVGIRKPGSEENMRGWASWQRNRMDARQSALYTGSAAHGLAFVWAVAGTDPMTGERMSVMKLASAQDMAAFYDDDNDEWPRLAILATPIEVNHGLAIQQEGWQVTIFEDTAMHYATCKGDGTQRDDWTYISWEDHGSKVTPVVRYAPNVDIDGRTNSDLLGMIPLLARIDQTTFDRLIVQRFGAWKIRYIAGMVKPTSSQEAAAQRLRLRVEDLLIAEDADTKFGTLDATDLAGFIAARDSDLRDASAISQTPPHHMLGLSSNLQAESLAAAEAGLQRKSRGHRTAWGESHEQLFRLDAHLRGDREEERAFQTEGRWRDTESRSLEQAAMALGMLATNLKVPVEMLWERIPGWTDNDVSRAKKLVQTGGIDQFLDRLEAEFAAMDKTAPANAGV
jgi:Phage portal protein, SPP1 Gp6-like